ncbi:unnamed protein product, partial [Meganyctiphanes norvegica]
GFKTAPLNRKLKHIFSGDEWKEKGSFSGLHDGSALYPDGAHNLVGGTVVGVKKLGTGVAVHIMDPKLEWNKDNGNIRTKDQTTMFFGVPPKVQAAFILTAFHDEEKQGTRKGNIAVELAEEGKYMDQPGQGNPLIIQVNKDRKNDKIIGQAFPDIMQGTQYKKYDQIKKRRAG